jgi:hypothetical protein
MKPKFTLEQIEEDLVETDIAWLKGGYTIVDQDTNQILVALNLKEDEDGNLEEIVEEDDDELEDDDDDDIEDDEEI